MVVAWVFCASVGLILARYYKPMWTNSKACGQKVWFSYHRALMLTAMFLTILGFIIVLINQKGLFLVPSTLPTKAHPILGLIAIICALLNVSYVPIYQFNTRYVELVHACLDTHELRLEIFEIIWDL